MKKKTLISKTDGIINKSLKKGITIEKLLSKEETTKLKKFPFIKETIYLSEEDLTENLKNEGSICGQDLLTIKEGISLIKKDMLLDIKRRYPVEFNMTKEQFAKHLPLKSDCNKAKIHYWEKFNKVLQDNEVLVNMCDEIRKEFENGREGNAIFALYFIGQRAMKERLWEHLVIPSGAKVEAKRPTRFKYGGMYHDRIADNYKKGMGDRTTKDKPVTAKAEAARHVLDIYEKETGKTCTVKNLDLWRKAFLKHREELTGNN